MAGRGTETLSKGLFSTGTRPTRPHRPSHKDFENGTVLFSPEPAGPHEASTSEQTAAQDHYCGREIKLREAKGMRLPLTSYRDHYPGRAGDPTPKPRPDFPEGHVPFTSVTEYQKEFPGKSSGPFYPRVVDSQTGPIYRPLPMIQSTTTKQASYTPFSVPASPSKPVSRPLATEVDMNSFMNDTFSTTYGQYFPAKESRCPEAVTPYTVRPHMPMLTKSTTYGTEFFSKEVPVVPSPEIDLGAPRVPFDDRTTYNGEFFHKESMPDAPHLTGFKCPYAIRLSLPRRSLGLQYVEPGKSSDKFFTLIPRYLDAPCTGSNTFTTVHDDQEEACILILYGDEQKASENIVLGQFDIVNIPPAPKGVPRIAVTFHLDKNLSLTVSARDLDSERQKEWKQREEIIVRRG
ncbi:hypothetical protein BSKO_05078 [Bryopsis sp. KO-2023]|nr:hypothetical protein BSKO_05078 [Bryopsis sp. KO-2023]